MGAVKRDGELIVLDRVQAKFWYRVAVVAIVVGGGWLAILLVVVLGSELAYRNGFWPIDPSIDGKRVVMEHGWVPVASSKSAIPPFEKYPGVTYLKVYGLLWGTADTLVIRSFPQINDRDLRRAERVEQFGWGRAYILPKQSEYPDRVQAILGDYRLLATMKRLEVLKRISAIDQP